MNIVFIVVCEFPYGSASSMRARNLYKLMELAGHSVHVISDYNGNVGKEGCDIYSCEYIYDTPSRIRRRTAPYSCISRLKEYCKTNSVDCVLANARFDRFNMLARFCKKNKISYIVENCEWYDFSNFRFGKRNPDFIRNEKMLTSDFCKADGFISISKLLDEHNKSFGKPSVRIPTIIDTQKVEYSSKTKNPKLTLVYTGNCGVSKELLKPVIEALACNSNLRKSVEFHIYGPSYETVLANIGNDKKLFDKAEDSVKIYGRVSQDKISNIIMQADYMIFLRENRRSSNAGFPTKLGESFAAGTPVITNDTGDIGLYVKNGVNGYLLGDIDNASVEAALEQILSVTKEKYTEMRKNARITSEKHFDYRQYLCEINKILENNNV